MQVTVANFSEAKRNERIDAQFFKPEYVDSYNKVISGRYTLLSDIAHITDGNHLKIAEDFDASEGVRYLRGQDLGSDMMLNDRNVVYIPETVYDTLKRSHIYKNDVLITIVGANTGLVGLVYSPPSKIVANCKLGIARAYKGKILAGYLYAFLASKYGQHQLLRYIRGGGQTGLILPDMRQLVIARSSDSFENAVNDIVASCHEKALESKKTFFHAQEFLLFALGLSNWQPKHTLSFIKNYSDTVMADRIDAEFFQPKYDEIVKAIKSYPSGYSLIGKEFKQNKSVLKLDPEQTYRYVEIGSINVSTGEVESSEMLGSELPANAKRVLKENDVIVSKVRTYRGAMALVDQEGLIGSGAFTVLREHGQINKETLLTFLRSKPLLALSLKPNTGTSYPVILDNDILNLPIPLFNEDTQSKVKQKIAESFNMLKHSKHLLGCAKRVVEIAIEKNEDAAIKWLQEQTKETVL